jgi:hypothetical protein
MDVLAEQRTEKQGQVLARPFTLNGFLGSGAAGWRTHEAGRDDLDAHALLFQPLDG